MTQARIQSLLVRGFALTFFAAAASLGAFAQTHVATLVGDESNDYFGFSAASLGDVNADGIPDFGVGGYRGSIQGRGRIKVYSGLDGSLIHHILGPVNGSLGGVFAVGDVDGDGYADFGGNHAIAPATGWLFSGRDGSALAHQTWAVFVGGVGDLDSDGHADYVVHSLNSGTGPPIQVVSGATGSALLDLVVPSPGWLEGYVGDLNGDGAPDYATVHGGGSGVVDIRSGADATLLYTLPSARTGISDVVELGDTNQDGFSDIGVVFNGKRSIDILSGQDGSVLVTLRDLEYLIPPSSALSAVPDADGDGHDDFVVASYPPRLHSGRTGAILAQFVRDDGTRRSFSVAGVPDANGDGRPEIVVGSPAVFNPISFAGTAALFSYDGPAGTNYCMSTVNSSGAPAEITASGSTSLARNNLLLSVHSAPSGSLGIFLMGVGQQQTALGSGVLCVGSGGSGIARLPSASIDANGHMLVEFDFTSVSGGVGIINAGSTRSFQAWFRDSSSSGPVSNLSNAVSVTFTL